MMRSKVLSVFLVLILLVATLVSGLMTRAHSQLLQLGHSLWDGQYTLLRVDLPVPSCNPNPDIDAQLQILAKKDTVKDDIDALFDEPALFDEDAARRSLEASAQQCQERHAWVAQNHKQVTWSVRLFRSVELTIESVSLWFVNNQSLIFLALFFLAAWVSTLDRHHIAFRPVKFYRDEQVFQATSFFGHLLLLVCAWYYRSGLYLSGVAIKDPEILVLLLVGFSALTLLSFTRLVGVFDFKKLDALGLKPNGTWGGAFLAIPLYLHMAFISGFYFIWVEAYPAGLIVFMTQLLEQSSLFLSIALYIWVGLMLKQTELGQSIFKLLTPWKLPPEVMAFLAVLLMALPTAYTGASGIIVIAMGALIYSELKQLGARSSLALATTAMTGSAGVVLAPCLLVLLIAALNKEVVTDDLFMWGSRVFFVTMLVFAVVLAVTYRGKNWRPTPLALAWPETRLALRQLLPYVLILFFVLSMCAWLFNAYLDEFSAPFLLPCLCLGWLWYESRFKVRLNTLDAPKMRRLLGGSAGEAVPHIGALLMLMGMSFALGGIIERSHILDLFPVLSGNLWLSMSLVVMVLVMIGMIMDPFGAVVLVSGSIAPIAYAAGIEPLHFWMVTLVSFELGYLSPPVALNHLLVRQVVPEDAFTETQDDSAKSFWFKHERYVMPIVVMGTVLLLVAFVPLVFYKV